MLAVAANDQSVIYQPDLTQFFVPTTDSVLFGLFGSRYGQGNIHWGIETPSYLTWTVLLLCLIALSEAHGRLGRGWRSRFCVSCWRSARH